jgi:hypothetical protein
MSYGKQDKLRANATADTLRDESRSKAPGVTGVFAKLSYLKSAEPVFHTPDSSTTNRKNKIKTIA